MSNGNDYVDIANLSTSRVDGAGVRPWRVSLFTQVLLGCVWGRPSLEEMGLRLWLLCERLQSGCLPRTSAAMRKRLQQAETAAWSALQVDAGETSLADLGKVVDLLLLFRPKVMDAESLERMGKRVCLLGYAFERGDLMRAALPSFEVIGEMWGLTAENKRSAVSAAMKKLVKDLVKRGWLRHHTEAGMPELWFAKKAVTCEKYAEAQRGNGNRERGTKLLAVVGDGLQSFAVVSETTANHRQPLPTTANGLDDPDAPACVRERLREEHEQRLHGIRVKPEFAEMKPHELRRHLQGLHEAAERRRLGLE